MPASTFPSSAEQHQDQEPVLAATDLVDLRHALKMLGRRADQALRRVPGGRSGFLEAREGEILASSVRWSGKSTTFNLIAATCARRRIDPRSRARRSPALPRTRSAGRASPAPSRSRGRFASSRCARTSRSPPITGEAGGISRAEAQHRAEEAPRPGRAPTDATGDDRRTRRGLR